MRLVAVAAAATALATPIPASGGAGAGGGAVDLATFLATPQDLPVPDSPFFVLVEVYNDGPATATGVTVEVTLPADAVVTWLPDLCAPSPTGVTCQVADLGPGEITGYGVGIEVAATGTYVVGSEAFADQGDADGDSTAELAIEIVPEDADLAGRDETTRVVVGSQDTFRVFHDFFNIGPTGAGGATLAGTLSAGAEMVPGSFFFGIGGDNLADERCTVAAHEYACAPLTSASRFDPVVPTLYYDVELPDTPVVIEATATISGRNDDVPENDASDVTIDVDEPAAEIFTQLEEVPGIVPAGSPVTVNGPVINAGELPAVDVVAVLEAPADWTATLLPPDEPAETCAVEPSGHAIRCTMPSLDSQQWWIVNGSLTPPADAAGVGTVTLTVETDTPEIGTYPNVASIDIAYGPPRELTITPDTGLVDGDVVTVDGVHFVPGATVFYCQGIIDDQPTSDDCGAPFRSSTVEADGEFSVTWPVQRFMDVPGRGEIDCAQPAAPCGIGAADLLAPGGQAIIAPIAFEPRPPVDPFDGRILGTIVDAAGDPVSGAPVWAFRPGDTYYASLRTTTAADGSFVLEDAELGVPFRLLVFAPAGSGLASEWHSVEPAGGTPYKGSARVIQLGAGHPVAEATVALDTAGTIVGTVVDHAGMPVAGTHVSAFLPFDSVIGAYATLTGADGTFRIDVLWPGETFDLRFAPPADSGLVVEWFEDSPDRAGATDVTVPAEAVVTVDASLGPAP